MTRTYQEWLEEWLDRHPKNTALVVQAEQAQINPDWEPRYKDIRASFRFPIDTTFLAKMVADKTLTMDEANRSRWKIALLQPFVTRMIVNMIKGSLKYTSDDWSANTWQDMGMDDKADSINYGLLFEDYLRKEGKI